MKNMENPISNSCYPDPESDSRENRIQEALKGLGVLAPTQIETLTIERQRHVEAILNIDRRVAFYQDVLAILSKQDPK